MNDNQHHGARRLNRHGKPEARGGRRAREREGRQRGQGRVPAGDGRSDRSNGNVFDGTVLKQRTLDGPTRGWRLAPTSS